MCLLVFKLVPAEYATNAFSSKSKYEKLVFVVHVPRWRRIWSFNYIALQRTAKKWYNIFNARAQSLFCSLNLLFGDVPRRSRNEALVSTNLQNFQMALD